MGESARLVRLSLRGLITAGLLATAFSMAGCGVGLRTDATRTIGDSPFAEAARARYGSRLISASAQPALPPGYVTGLITLASGEPTGAAPFALLQALSDEKPGATNYQLIFQVRVPEPGSRWVKEYSYNLTPSTGILWLGQGTRDTATTSSNRIGPIVGAADGLSLATLRRVAHEGASAPKVYSLSDPTWVARQIVGTWKDAQTPETWAFREDGTLIRWPQGQSGASTRSVWTLRGVSLSIDGEPLYNVSTTGESIYLALPGSQPYLQFMRVR